MHGSEEGACDATSTHCVTCGDDAVPLRVLGVDEDRGLAVCAAEDGVRSDVEIALVEPVAPGDVLLVHAGTALLRVQP
jgi:hydrogenase maturation factor